MHKCHSTPRLRPSCWYYFLSAAEVLGLGAFFEMVGILEGFAPLPGLLGVSEVSEQTDRES